MLAFLELTPRFKKLKRRASLEFCVHLDESNRNRLFYKTVSGNFESFFIVLKPFSQVSLA